MVGARLAHYTIEDKLGEGGMGVVYEALNVRLDRAVALKILPPDVLLDGTRKQRFGQEAKSASSLNHPNIVTVYEISAGRRCRFHIDGVDPRSEARVRGPNLGQQCLAVEGIAICVGALVKPSDHLRTAYAHVRHAL